MRDKKYLTKNINHCKERVALLTLRITRAKKAGCAQQSPTPPKNLDQGNSIDDLEERLKGFKGAQVEFEKELVALSPEG